MIIDQGGFKRTLKEAAKILMRHGADVMMDEMEDTLDRIFPGATALEREAIQKEAEKIYFSIFKMLS